MPNSDGMYTVNPASTTRRPNAIASGCKPGTSWITITAGPLPARNTGRLVPSCVNVDSAKPSS